MVYLQGCSLNHIKSFLVFFQLGTTDVPMRPCPSTASRFPLENSDNQQEDPASLHPTYKV